MENKFTWGELVLILNNAPMIFHPGELASVCGFYHVASNETAVAFKCNVGEWVYTVEFGDGSDVEVAEPYLMKYESTAM